MKIRKSQVTDVMQKNLDKHSKWNGIDIDIESNVVAGCGIDESLCCILS